MDYIHIKGTVGKTKVDLQLSIPVEQILAQAPETIDKVIKAYPKIMEQVEENTSLWLKAVNKASTIGERIKQKIEKALT